MKKNLGMSLVEVMVASAILGGLSLVVMNLTSTQQKAMDYIDTKTEEIDLHNRIRMALLRKEACEQTFQSQALDSDFSEIKNAAGTVLYNTGQVFPGEDRGVIELESLKIENESVPASGGLGVANIVIQTKRLKSSVNETSPLKKLPLSVRADASGTITDCFSDEEGMTFNAADLACQSIGGIYDKDINSCDLSAFEQDPEDNLAVSTKYLSESLNALNEGDHTSLGTHTGTSTFTNSRETWIMVSVWGGSNNSCGQGNNRYDLRAEVETSPGNYVTVARVRNNNSDYAKVGHISFMVPAGKRYRLSSSPWSCGPGRYSMREMRPIP